MPFPLFDIKKSNSIHLFLLTLAFSQTIIYIVLFEVENTIKNKWLKTLIFFGITILIYYLFYVILGFDQDR